MNEFKGTPGPWSYDEQFGDIGDSNGVIAEVIVNGRSDDNGLLIAAAPDLLEALQDALHAYDKHGEHAEWDYARAAIAKALGQ